MSDQVTKMTNKSKNTVPVELEGGQTVFVPPRGTLENQSVANLDRVRPHFQVEQNLTEVNPVSPPESPRVNLNEPRKPSVKPSRRRRPLNG